MKRKITGIAAALTVLFGAAPQAAEVTPAEAVNLTVEDFDKITDQWEQGTAIHYALTTVHNYYTVKSQDEKAACMINLYNTPLA